MMADSDALILARRIERLEERLAKLEGDIHARWARGPQGTSEPVWRDVTEYFEVKDLVFGGHIGSGYRLVKSDRGFRVEKRD